LKIRLKDILKGLLLLIIIADINAAELKISEINSSELNSSELSLALYYDEVEEGVEELIMAASRLILFYLILIKKLFTASIMMIRRY